MSNDPQSDDSKSSDSNSEASGEAPSHRIETKPSGPVETSGDWSDQDDGPGCMPAVIAATVLMGIAGFIFCGVSTWYLYQQRTALAVRTLEGGYVPEIEQSLLDEATKNSILTEVNSLIDEMKRGNLENWQSAGVMQRVQRLPVLQWGDMQATEAFVEKNGTPEQIAETRNQFKRIRLGVKQGQITSFDLYDMLAPVQVEDRTVASGKRIRQPILIDGAVETTNLAKLLADREKISDPPKGDGRIDQILRDEIKMGIQEGGR